MRSANSKRNFLIDSFKELRDSNRLKLAMEKKLSSPVVIKAVKKINNKPRKSITGGFKPKALVKKPGQVMEPELTKLGSLGQQYIQATEVGDYELAGLIFKMIADCQ